MENTMSEETGQKLTEMKQLNIFDDISPHKLHRKNDPETSKEAAYSVPLSKRRAFVLNLIEEAGAKGITIREMTKQFPDMSSSSITSRPNELEKLNLIFYAGDKRDGSRVIRHIKYKTNEQ
jgi:Tfp pilus assembly ATPase PilU